MAAPFSPHDSTEADGAGGAQLAESCVLNVALVTADGTLCTPRFDSILAGLTVQRVMELARVGALIHPPWLATHPLGPWAKLSLGASRAPLGFQHPPRSCSPAPAPPAPSPSPQRLEQLHPQRHASRPNRTTSARRRRLCLIQFDGGGAGAGGERGVDGGGAARRAHRRGEQAVTG
jgi:hypothetical protein